MAKSFFFQNFDPAEEGNRTFLDDLTRLVGAPDSWSVLQQQIGKYIRVASTPDKRRVVEAVAQELHLPAVTVAFHMRCLETLLAAFSENDEETPESLAADFVEIGGLPKHQLESIERLLREVRSTFENDKILIDEADARNGAQPILDFVRTTTELRGVFHRTGDGVEHFRGFVGIISIQLVYDNREDTYFQCDRGLAEHLISELQAGLKRLSILEERQSSDTSVPASSQSRTA